MQLLYELLIKNPKTVRDQQCIEDAELGGRELTTYIWLDEKKNAMYFSITKQNQYLFELCTGHQLLSFKFKMGGISHIRTNYDVHADVLTPPEILYRFADLMPLQMPRVKLMKIEH